MSIEQKNATGRRSVLIAHPSSELYGSDRVMLDTVAALVERGWSVTVTLPDDGPLVAAVETVGGQVRRCPTPVLRKSALRPRGMVTLVGTILRSIRPGLQLLRAARPDVVYVSTVTVPLWFVLAKVTRTGSVCHVHEAEVGAHKIVRRAMAAPLLLTRSILANSEFSLQVLTDALPRLRSRAQVVPNPVPGPDAAVPARLDLVEPVRLLYVGRLSPRKGPQLLVRALRMVVDDGVDAELDLLGSVFPGYEWFEEELHADVERLGLSERVRFLGFRPDVWPEIARADIVLVPSVAEEPFGNTAVEAVLAARPVIASASGGLVEAAQGYGSAQTVPPGETTPIADAVAIVVADWPKFRAAAAADADIAAERHSPVRYGERIERALLAVIGSDSTVNTRGPS